MTGDRPDIPLPVARQLRQEAGFGCCRCGRAILEYHHIVPFHDDDPYPISEMMTLCPLCHTAATKDALTVNEQWAMKANPCNLQRGFAEGHLKVNQAYIAVQVGGIMLVSDRPVVSIDGQRLLALSADEDGHLSLSVTLYNERGDLLAVIENNDWLSGDPLPWDLESDFQYLRIRQKLGDIAIEIDARMEPVRLRANLWHNGQLVSLNPQAITVGRAGSSGAELRHLGLVGLELAVNTSRPGGLDIQPHPRYGAGAFVSQADEYDRLRESVLAWRRLRDPASVPAPDPTGRPIALGRNDPCWCGSGRKLKRCHQR